MVYTPIAHRVPIVNLIHARIGLTLLPRVSIKADHHHPEDETKALKTRIRKIVGQLNGVERMIEVERDCAEILTQLVSARKALKSLSEKIIRSHLHYCIDSPQRPEEARRKMRELLDVLQRYVD
jgi:DNA-binding FrmR family transcriptional regulator